MGTFLLSFNATTIVVGSAHPTLEVLIGGTVVSSLEMESGATSYDVLVDFSGAAPSSLSLRFAGSSGDIGDSISFNSVAINNTALILGSDLTSTILMQSQASTVSAADDLYGYTAPTLGVATVTGTTNDDESLTSSNSTGDTIEALAGNDWVYGRGGDDEINGGAGADHIFGEAGNDTILGGAGDDTIFGNEGDDVLYGEADNDFIIGGGGSDLINGGSGNDGVLGDGGNDIIFGEGGDDWLAGDAGEDVLLGGAGNDQLMGGEGGDSISGGADNDFISGGIGEDLLSGGAGDDQIFAGADNDTIYSGGGNDTILGDGGVDVIAFTNAAAAIDVHLLNNAVSDDGDGGVDYIQEVENVDGSAYNDIIIADDIDNVLNGWIGNDTIEGSGGSDTINGGEGDDVLYANSSGGSTQDQINAILAANSGLTYSSDTGNFYMLETSGANYATASADAASRFIDGVAGHIVTITSAAENNFIDNLLVASTWIAGSDRDVEGEWDWIEGPEAGTQFWQGIGSGSGGAAVGGAYSNWSNAWEPNDYGSGEDYIEMRTNGVWNDIRGTDSRDYVIEWDGSSLYTTATGDVGTTNTLFGGDGDDMIYGAGGVDTLSGDAGNDTISGGEADDQINGGDGQDNLNGDAGNDTVYGDGDNDIVNGGIGDDTLYGGDGNDQISGDFASGFVVTESGWQYEYYDLGTSPTNLASAGFTLNGGRDNSNVATSTGVTQDLNPTNFDSGDNYALKFETTLTITTAGTYTFRTRSDDGSQLFLDGVQIVDNDGLHGAVTVTSSGQVLAAGTYTLEATFFERTGGNVMEVTMSGADTGNVYTDLGPYAGVTYQTISNANGADTLYGGDGDDTLFGGDGLDTLYGEAGADTFVFESDSAFSNIDVISGFTTADNDVIDISDVLSGLGVNAGNISDYVEISSSNGVRVDVSGSGSFGAATQISSFAGATSVSDEATMLTNGHLII